MDAEAQDDSTEVLKIIRTTGRRIRAARLAVRLLQLILASIALGLGTQAVSTLYSIQLETVVPLLFAILALPLAIILSISSLRSQQKPTCDERLAGEHRRQANLFAGQTGTSNYFTIALVFVVLLVVMCLAVFSVTVIALSVHSQPMSAQYYLDDGAITSHAPSIDETHSSRLKALCFVIGVLFAVSSVTAMLSSVVRRIVIAQASCAEELIVHKLSKAIQRFWKF